LSVNATVTDDDNRPVMQLGSEHFHIWEDKVEQQIKPYRIREVRSLQMAVDNPTVRWVVIGLVVLLLVPLVVMLGIMAMCYVQWGHDVADAGHDGGRLNRRNDESRRHGVVRGLVGSRRGCLGIFDHTVGPQPQATGCPRQGRMTK